MSDTYFYSKILLFGEYAILKNSRGLSIPYRLYKGSLKFGELNKKKVKESNNILIRFCEYIECISIKNKFDLKKMKTDIKSGLYFESSIPIGYGIGSSGALVAALYEKYYSDKVLTVNNLDNEKNIILKNVFSIMESFFHGESSGLDPLNSYLNSPILINSKKEIEIIEIPIENINGNKGFFLIDSGLNRNTESLVNLFFELMEDKDVSNAFDKEFIYYTNKCVDNLLKSEFNELFMNTKKISKFILENFEFMIPKGFKNLWKKGISSEDFILKPCGSGGGGFILGLSMDLNKAKSYFSKFSFKVVFSF
jgi:mevalonate kinase